MGQVTPATRREVLARDGGRCVAERLPGPCWGHMDMGHIVGRGTGGGDGYDGPEWVLSMCRWHNGQVEDNPDVAEQAKRWGMKVARNHTALIPDVAVVRYPDGIWYELRGAEKVPHVTPWASTTAEPGQAWRGMDTHGE